MFQPEIGPTEEVHPERLMCQAESRDDCNDDSHWQVVSAKPENDFLEWLEDQRRLCQAIVPDIPDYETSSSVLTELIARFKKDWAIS